jgi:signal transduction histidine kinase
MNAAEHPNGETLAVFAHELRQPLASILFAVRSIYESGDDKGANRKMCEIVERQARFVAQMIEDVLEVSCCRRGKLSLDKRRVDLDSVIAGAIEATKPLIADRGHHLTVTLPDKTLSVVADPVRLQQVVTNLLVNAAKYTQHGGCIRLAVDATPELVMIRVCDNGMGIPAELLPRVFDMFEQGSVARHRDRRGLGIGLALVKSLVELHGGSVSAQSDGQGAGSAFVVRLPAASRDGSDRPHAASDAPAGRQFLR